MVRVGGVIPRFSAAQIKAQTMAFGSLAKGVFEIMPKQRICLIVHI
jgi:hypothetical protein